MTRRQKMERLLRAGLAGWLAVQENRRETDDPGRKNELAKRAREIMSFLEEMIVELPQTPRRGGSRKVDEDCQETQQRLHDACFDLLHTRLAPALRNSVEKEMLRCRDDRSGGATWRSPQQRGA